MKRIILILVLLPFLSYAQDLPLIDSMMAQVNLTSSDIRFDQDEMSTWGSDTWRLSYFTMFHKNPFKLPKYGQLNLESFSADCANITGLVANAGRKIDCPVRRSLISDPLAKFSSDSLRFPDFIEKNKALSGPEYASLKYKISLVYSVIDDQPNMFVESFADIDRKAVQSKLFTFFTAESLQYNDMVESLVAKMDFNKMIGGAEDLAEAMRRAADSLEYCPFPGARLEFKTNKGLIIIGTLGDDKYDFGSPPLLILDPGGNDVYRISGYSENYPFSGIIDVSGNDKYISPDSTLPGIGGAILGMAVLIDKAGDDFYDGVSVTQGSALFGVSVLMDYSGNDKYRSKYYSQGSAVFGAGILSDSAGVDSLYCWAYSQGYGYTKGCGLCINYSGDDYYLAEDSILFSPGQQTKEHNSSLAQGVGFGKRADFIDGHSWAGGVGILCDISGDDHYSAGLFGQGCGYWFAVGMLLDGGGNDIYHSVWYTLGSGAHFAVGYLDDFDGDDNYTATMNMSIGSGHDFTIGYLNDRAGDDIYNAPGLSLGGGNFQGIGIFNDWSGNDTYNTSADYYLGGANGIKQGARAYLYTFGVFIDGGGDDTYKDSWAANHTRWITPKSDSTRIWQYDVGLGIDK